jgi:tRNA/rRNA methyltransferase
VLFWFSIFWGGWADFRGFSIERILPMNLENMAVVLVEPQGPLNIGSVCRVMMNFGLSDLRLVNPATDHLVDDARRMAVKATPLLEGARLYASLGEALADCHLAAGTTRRFGKYREDFLHPDDAAATLLEATFHGRVAWVFGREDKGLTTAELEMCQRFITIPTMDECPSMNLAQARGKTAGQRKVASIASQEAMFGHMRSTLLDIGYLDPQNPDHILRSYRRIFSRAGLTDREVRILRGLWSRIDWVEGERRKGQGNDGTDH